MKKRYFDHINVGELIHVETTYDDNLQCSETFRDINGDIGFSVSYPFTIMIIKKFNPYVSMLLVAIKNTKFNWKLAKTNGWYLDNRALVKDAYLTRTQTKYTKL